MRFGRIIVALVLAAMCASTAWVCSAYAHDIGAHGYQQDMAHRHALAKAIGITEEQKAQMKDILQKYRPAFQSLRKQYREEKHVLHKLTYADSINESAIREQTSKISQVESSMAIQRAHLIHDLRSVLTHEQLQKLSEIAKHRVDAQTDRYLFRFAGAGKEE
ncbi:MAG TPA: Spy/CpxP family protein refolding chaperone [Dissulfurispiraceae bacterium]|nr:Spy/CpxP family protein refolding chaperone [Dissulfurispiraceae bacterium]